LGWVKSWPQRVRHLRWTPSAEAVFRPVAGVWLPASPAFPAAFGRASDEVALVFPLAPARAVSVSPRLLLALLEQKMATDLMDLRNIK